MGLTESQRAEYAAALVKRNWSSEGDTIWSPSRGLWFGPSHFEESALRELERTFARRAERIRSGKVYEGWEISAQENTDVADVARELLKNEDTQP